jgi:hypothetical protein
LKLLNLLQNNSGTLLQLTVLNGNLKKFSKVNAWQARIGMAVHHNSLWRGLFHDVFMHITQE